MFSSPSSGKSRSIVSSTLRIFFHKTALVRPAGIPVSTNVRIAFRSTTSFSTRAAGRGFFGISALLTLSPGAGYPPLRIS